MIIKGHLRTGEMHIITSPSNYIIGYMPPSFINNVLKLVSGSVIAQAAGILLIPVITRIYSPDDFGIFQLLISISGIIAVMSCLSYQLSIMLPEDDEDAANITVLCGGLIMVTSVISGLLILIFKNQIAEVLNAPGLAEYMVFIPIIVFFNGLFFVLNYWLSRHVRFGSVAVARVTNSLTNKGIQIGAGMAIPPSPLGLITGATVGYTLADLIMLRNLRKDINLFKNVSIKRIKELAIRYKKFPILTSWSTLSNQVSLQISPFMLAFFFSPTVVGFYSIAHMAVSMPMGLIGGAVGQVFFQKASDEKNRTGSIKNIVKEVHRRLISIGILPMLLLVIIGEEVFNFVLGAKWETAGLYAKILAPWIFLVFIASPLSTVFSVLERQGIGLSFNISILISRIAMLYIGGIYGDPITALILFSGSGVLFWGWMNMYVLKISEVKIGSAIKESLKYTLLALTVSLPLIFVKYLAMPLYIIFTIAIISTSAYYLLVILEDGILRTELIGILKRD